VTLKFYHGKVSLDFIDKYIPMIDYFFREEIIMQSIYCANCGTRLNVMNKALPKFGQTIKLAEYHECLDEPVELDLTPITVPKFENPEGKDKFVENLNDLTPPVSLGRIGTDTLRDRRTPDHVKSEAPGSVLDQMGRDLHTTPANDIKDEPEE